MDNYYRIINKKHRAFLNHYGIIEIGSYDSNGSETYVFIKNDDFLKVNKDWYNLKKEPKFLKDMR